MIPFYEYKGHESNLLGKRKLFDNNIYTFDIETSNYIELNGEILPASKYQELNKKEQQASIKMSCMYIWQFSINDVVYYGRTWKDLKKFLNKLEDNVPEKKYVFVHNLAFEFQYLKSYFSFSEVSARKSHKVMSAVMKDYNIIFKCTYFMSNCSLAKLPQLFDLPVKKMVGDLDYDLIRTSNTPLTEKELSYCEYDCLVVYHYIKKELEEYENVKNLPNTSTGKVRRELYNLVMTDFKYKRLVKKAINTNPHIYNLLQEAFAGGYTHANWIYTDEVIENVDSYDFTSSYPYVLVTNKFPSSEFKYCNIKNVNQMNKKLAYLLVVKFKNIKCKYFNNFISASKCRNIKGAKYDNGRLIEAKEIIIVLTDIDFYFILDSYKCSYEIVESYFANYNYLPKQFIDFVLQKYVNKTKFKDVNGKELEYQKEKNKFNSLYGMSVTNMIRDKVNFDDETKMWEEEELTNEEIIEKLLSEKKKAFLSFAYGVWVTAYARNNLLRNVIKLDEFVIYCDTDSMKLKQGYDKSVIDDYNKFVENKINRVSKLLNIDVERYAPKDSKGKKHMLGLFECETKENHVYTYDKFITQGAKKYAYELDGKISITVAGVPKKGAKALKRLEDFKDDFVFKHEDTDKNMVIYTENQKEVNLTDYLGKTCLVKDVSGCCILPNTYVLSKSLEYANLITDDSSKRAKFKEV
mgnify:CR=1 FL=1